MPLPFEGPSSNEDWSLYDEWSRNVGPDMKSPELLLSDYWERFNTVKIPLLPKRAYFETALEIAKLSKDKEEFERRFEEHNSKRKEEILEMMSQASTDALSNRKVKERVCPDALTKAGHACVTGCLQDFLQVTKGVIYGWEAKQVFDNTPEPCKNCGSTQLLSCLDCDAKLDLCGDCGQQEHGCLSCMSQYFDTNPAHLYRTYAEVKAFQKRQEDLNRIVRDAEEVNDERRRLDHEPSSCMYCGSARLLSCKLCALKLHYCGDCGEQLDSCLKCSSQCPDYDLEQTARMINYKQMTPPSSDDSNAKRLSEAEFFTFSTEHNRALEDEPSQQATGSAMDNATSSITEEPQTFYQRETGSPGYDDFVDAVEYQESACSTPTSSSTATLIIDAPASDQTAPKKRKRVSFSGVDDVFYYSQESLASTQQATTDETWIREMDDYGRVPKRQKVENSPMRGSRKRSRYHDDHDHDGNHTRKRQKLKSPSTLGSKLINPASPLAKGQDAPKKRSRCNDGDDDTNSHAQKRQKFTSYSFYGSLELDALIAADTDNHTEKRQRLTDYSFYERPELDALIAADALVDPPSPPAARPRNNDGDGNGDDIGYHTQMPETPPAYPPISRASSLTRQGASINKRRKKSLQNLERSQTPRPVNTRSLRRRG